MPARAAALRAEGDQNAGGWFSGVLTPTDTSWEEADPWTSSPPCDWGGRCVVACDDEVLSSSDWEGAIETECFQVLPAAPGEGGGIRVIHHGPSADSCRFSPEGRAAAAARAGDRRAAESPYSRRKALQATMRHPPLIGSPGLASGQACGANVPLLNERAASATVFRRASRAVEPFWGLYRAAHPLVLAKGGAHNGLPLDSTGLV
jgi:hypothetical protein